VLIIQMESRKRKRMVLSITRKLESLCNQHLQTTVSEGRNPVSDLLQLTKVDECDIKCITNLEFSVKNISLLTPEQDSYILFQMLIHICVDAIVCSMANKNGIHVH